MPIVTLSVTPFGYSGLTWVNPSVVWTRGLKANTWVDFVSRYCGVLNRMSDFADKFSDVMVLVQYMLSSMLPSHYLKKLTYAVKENQRLT